MKHVTASSVVAALIALTVMALTFLGALEDVWGWVRSLAQAGGTLAGVYLGSRLQNSEDKGTVDGAARGALASLYALVVSVRHLSSTIQSFQLRMADSPPNRVDAFQQVSESLATGVAAHISAIEAQADAAARAWFPFMDEPNAYMNELIKGQAAKEVGE